MSHKQYVFTLKDSTGPTVFELELTRDEIGMLQNFQKNDINIKDRRFNLMCEASTGSLDLDFDFDLNLEKLLELKNFKSISLGKCKLHDSVRTFLAEHVGESNVNKINVGFTRSSKMYGPFLENEYPVKIVIWYGNTSIQLDGDYVYSITEKLIKKRFGIRFLSCLKK